jgi:hypothetical protein
MRVWFFFCCRLARLFRVLLCVGCATRLIGLYVVCGRSNDVVVAIVLWFVESVGVPAATVVDKIIVWCCATGNAYNPQQRSSASPGTSPSKRERGV